ncbi:MAG: hypothetical protein QNJ78_13365 [Gammaproteobacteria bacterium]|nr:hypothetical protein [Gammaproteobacteria bacterium]
MYLRTTAFILSFTSTVILTACGQQEVTPDVDPQLGRDCFQSKLSSLPPGSQYEGIEGKDGNQLIIKVMDGTGVITVECILADDKTLPKN